MLGEIRGVYMVLARKLKVRSYLENPVIDRRIILRWIFKK
jgi:hypothetical protein